MKTTLVILFALIANLSIAQSNKTFVFRVLANKGANHVKKAADGKKVILRPGLTLMQDDEIIASSGAYIGLMHRTGRTIELRASGVTKITDLETKLANSKTTVAGKYANYVMAKMNGKGESHYRANMKATGAVERSSGTAISAMLPSSVSVLNPEAIVRWNSVDNEDYYVVSVKNIFDEELLSAETTKPYIKLNLDDENLANEQLIILNIKAKDNPDVFSPDYGIERLTVEKKAEIMASLTQLKSEISGDSPLGKLILASYFEENGLTLDALTQYEDILEQSPDVEDFKVLYGEFLLRNGLSTIEE